MSAKVRFLHACPDHSHLDGFCQDCSLCSGIKYQSCTDYYDIDYGNQSLTICKPNQHYYPLTSAYTHFYDSQYHTAIATGYGSNFSLFILPDGNISTVSTKAYVRFVNVSPDNPCLDFKFTNGAFAIINNIEYREVTQYYPISPGNYTMNATVCDTDYVVLTVPSLNLRAGRSYTIYITGLSKKYPYCNHLLCEDGCSSCHYPTYPDYDCPSCTYPGYPDPGYPVPPILEPGYPIPPIIDPGYPVPPILTPDDYPDAGNPIPPIIMPR